MADEKWMALGDVARRVGRRPATVLQWSQTRGVHARKIGGRWQVDVLTAYRAAGIPMIENEELVQRIAVLETQQRQTDEAIATLHEQLQQLLPQTYIEQLGRSVDVARFLERHIDGIKFKTLIDWYLPLNDGNAALQYAIDKTLRAKGRGHGRRIYQCRIQGCPCHSLDLPQR